MPWHWGRMWTVLEVGFQALIDWRLPGVDASLLGEHAEKAPRRCVCDVLAMRASSLHESFLWVRERRH